MVNTSAYLKHVWHKNNDDLPDVLRALGLALYGSTILFPFWVNNIALGIYAFIVLYTYKKGQFYFQKTLLWPIVLFLLALLSLLWSIDSNKTLSSIPTQIPLLVVPVLFFLQPKHTASQYLRILTFFSTSTLGFAFFFLLRAIARFIKTQEIEVFFYHELVTLPLNAIYVSVFVCISFFYFLIYGHRFRTTILLFLGLFLVLLASKNIIVVWGLLLILYFIWHQKKIRFTKKTWVVSVVIIILTLLATPKIKDRFLLESQVDVQRSKSKLAKEISNDGVNFINIHQAWYNNSFSTNDFFTGTSFRVYQIRIYKEMMQEDAAYLLGYGFNATQKKRTQKAKELGVFMGNEQNSGYHLKNFHNQYVQYLAELGVIGFIVLLTLLIISIKKAIIHKNFLHFGFSILMISLFLTESFLWRQRGVAFFIFFYCLFHATIPINTKSKFFHNTN